MDKPLSGMVLQFAQSGEPRVGYRFGGTTSGTIRTEAVARRLTAAGVPHTVLTTDLSAIPENQQPGMQKLPTVPSGIEIQGEENIARYIDQGGIAVKTDSLKGKSFQRALGKDELRHEDREGKVAPLLEQQGIKFARDAQWQDALTITDRASMAAVALAGGVYTRSDEFARDFVRQGR